ncbi:hypothetical protein BKG75_25180 [Mycobacteroides chelonae]|uniref:hypothetical protein n=1 Tax=Mycobacteroides chelonae TaxID=1774 RepID=UPI0008AA5B32|nr:hypothetical protein [Mycobacteroides chelonae]AYM42818.1 hypothetical protein DYE20_15905 [[Mycobacterium] chelonae subsp. gwanakae]OHU09425.1 hypothetical protein BKG75_25180 [Mycobacteroides chelonae]
MSIKTGLFSVLVVLVVLVATVTAGCTPGRGKGTAATSSPATPTVQQLHPPFSFVWSADAGVDIFSRPAELIRATQEALDLTHIYGPEKTFPGYLKAIGGPKDPRDPDYQFETTSQSTGGGWATTNNSPMTNYRHITDLTVSAEGKNIGAYVCVLRILSPDNDAFGTGPQSGSVGTATRFELSSISPDQVQSAVDKSPDVQDPRAEMPPTWDVFTGWHITKIDQLLSDKVPSSCGDWFHQRLPFLVQTPGHGTVHPPNGGSFQMPREPVKPQFPEWIKSNQA